MRASMTGWRRRALPGTMTYLAGLRGYFCTAGGLTTRSPSSTSVSVCDRRVVSRSSTGVSNCSLISSATPTSSLASWLSEGSRQGTRANLA